jgi:hypothetical protein
MKILSHNLSKIIGTVALVYACAPVSAQSFAERSTVADSSLQLCAQTEMTVMWFDLGKAALYLEDCNDKHRQLNQPMQLSFIYHREFDAEDFIESAEKLLKRNLTQAEYASLEHDLRAFNQNYQGVKKGDRYDIRFINNAEVELVKNGRTISQTSSSILREKYPLIWFGKDPFDKQIKRDLLKALDS